MLTHPTLDQLRALRLDGMAEAFAELQAQDGARDMPHAEWLALLIGREVADRNTRRFRTRLRAAALRHVGAAIKDVDHRTPRRAPRRSATRRQAAGHPGRGRGGNAGVGRWRSRRHRKRLSNDGSGPSGPTHSLDGAATSGARDEGDWRCLSFTNRVQLTGHIDVRPAPAARTREWMKDSTDRSIGARSSGASA